MQEQEIIQRIKTLCEIRGWSLYRLAKQSGITYSTLCTMLHKATAPSIPTLVKLCRGFGISLSEFFDTENGWSLLSEEQKAHLQQWNALTPENQQAARKYIGFLLDGQAPRKTNSGAVPPEHRR